MTTTRRLTFRQMMCALWALESALMENALTEAEQDALIEAVFKVIISKR